MLFLYENDDRLSSPILGGLYNLYHPSEIVDESGLLPSSRVHPDCVYFIKYVILQCTIYTHTCIYLHGFDGLFNTPGKHLIASRKIVLNIGGKFTAS